MKTTTIKINDTTINIESDDEKIHEMFARLIVEKVALPSAAAPEAKPQKGLVSREIMQEIVDRCGKVPTQIAILKLLAKSEKGEATRKEMREAAMREARKNHWNAFNKEDGHGLNQSLAGCRGSMSKTMDSAGKRAGISHRDIWQDIGIPGDNLITRLDKTAHQHLRDILVEEESSHEPRK